MDKTENCSYIYTIILLCKLLFPQILQCHLYAVHLLSVAKLEVNYCFFLFFFSKERLFFFHYLGFIDAYVLYVICSECFCQVYTFMVKDHIRIFFFLTLNFGKNWWKIEPSFAYQVSIIRLAQIGRNLRRSSCPASF